MKPRRISLKYYSSTLLTVPPERSSPNVVVDTSHNQITRLRMCASVCVWISSLNCVAGTTYTGGRIMRMQNMYFVAQILPLQLPYIRYNSDACRQVQSVDSAQSLLWHTRPTIMQNSSHDLINGECLLRVDASTCKTLGGDCRICTDVEVAELEMSCLPLDCMLCVVLVVPAHYHINACLSQY